MEYLIIIAFIIGYLLIALEHPINVNKAATALVTGVLCWTLFALDLHGDLSREIHNQFIKSELSHHLAQVSEILFFLIGAMTIVELIDMHHGFRFITDRITTKDIRKLLWIICWVTFFLSAILDNLATAIVMVSLTRKLIPDPKQRMFFSGMIVIAANAGGAWSPIGDVTTTMLWIGGQVSAGAIVTQLLLPSIICLLIPLIYLSFTMKGKIERRIYFNKNGNMKKGRLMLFVGAGALISVPIFKTLTHLPPYMGMLLGLGILWIVSELIHSDLDDPGKKKYSALTALSRIDISSMLFFMGILLAVGALESMQVLHHLAEYLDNTLGDNRIIISVIGVMSSVVDNVPLVAACMGMYSIDTYPVDHMLWQYLAYCAGTGGSLLIIGSAAGVAVMGMEKIDFIWYLKKISWLALMGYVAGAIMFILT